MTSWVNDHAGIVVELDRDIVRPLRVRLDEGDDSVAEREIARPIVVDAHVVTDP